MIDHENNIVTNEIQYLTADEEDDLIVAQANEPLDENGWFVNERITCRWRDQFVEVPRITKAIQDGDFFQVKEFNDAIDNCLKNGTDLHLFGLLSDGGVHSHNEHLYALVELAKKRGLDRVYIHCFMDGRGKRWLRLP